MHWSKTNKKKIMEDVSIHIKLPLTFEEEEGLSHWDGAREKLLDRCLCSFSRAVV